MRDAAEVLFAERQRFRQAWFWLLILFAAAFVWYAAVMQFLFARPVGTNPPPDPVLGLLVLLIGLAVPALLLSVRLDTAVTREGIEVRLFPLHLKPRRFRFEHIASLEARRYSPILEYGGWGWRFGPGGWAYNVSGRMGIQLVLRSGRRLLIGTQRPDEFMAAVAAARGR